MNLQDLMSKLKSIDEGAMPPLAPTKDNVPADTECGMPVAIGGPSGAPKQQDNVTMNVSMNGSGAGGISDLMKILRNIEDSANKDPHQHDVSQLFGEPEAGPEEPIMGDIVAKLAHEELDGEDSPMTHDNAVDETLEDEEESWGNSLNGASGHHTHGVKAVTFSGDDMNSKGKVSPLQRVPGSNTLREPSNVSEDLVSRLSQMYNAIKEERTEEKDKDGNVIRWKEEGEWTKSTAKKGGRGKVTNLSDKARRESEKLSKKDESTGSFGSTATNQARPTTSQWAELKRKAALGDKRAQELIRRGENRDDRWAWDKHTGDQTGNYAARDRMTLSPSAAGAGQSDPAFMDPRNVAAGGAGRGPMNESEDILKLAKMLRG